MCGITGFITPKTPASQQQSVLQRMADSIAHRGPDDAGYFMDGETGLAMRRLSIIDLGSGKQPIFNEDGNLVIVFNGEIYNYRQLRNRLLAKGHRFSTQSDTETILHAYEEYGTDCPNHLNGMFAFAIFNKQDRSLFVARDRFGIKPLYYAQTSAGLVFGSELKAVVQHPSVSRTIDFEALSLYLSLDHVPAPLSIFKQVRKLQQGHYLHYRQGQVEMAPYYKLTFQPKFTETNESFYINELDRLLNDAVQARTVADVPLGAFLSGGIDSSLVTAYLQKNSVHKVQTFSIGFHEKSFDESSHARLVAKHLGTEHHEAYFSPQEAIRSLPHILDKLDEPFADASLLPTYFLSRFTRQHVTVSLSGDAADELFAGYPTYYARKLGRWIPPWAYHVAKPLAGLLPVSDDNISFDFKVKQFVKGLPYAQDERNQVWLGSFDGRDKHQLLSREVQRQLGGELSGFGLLRYYMKQCDTAPNWERSLWCDMRFYLQDNMLVKVDRASMMSSLEARVPFLDHRLVEFANRMPANLKYRGRTSKYILKKLADRYLPVSIVSRPKKGFGIPVAKWIKSELKGEFAQSLSPERMARDGYFDPVYVSGLLAEHHQNKKDNRKLLWNLYVFQQWLDRFA